VVLADAAEHVDEIDEDRAQEAMSRARERMASRGEDVDLERALQSLRRATVRIDIARRRRARRSTAVPSPQDTP
jgi:F-type H+-transporting ATPase subunit epsilon